MREVDREEFDRHIATMELLNSGPKAFWSPWRQVGDHSESRVKVGEHLVGRTYFKGGLKQRYFLGGSHGNQ